MTKNINDSNILTFDLETGGNIVQRISVDNTSGAQNITIADDSGVFNVAPDFSTLLHLKSNKAGFAFPEMTTIEMNAIANPRAGIVVHNTDNNILYIYTQNSWVNLHFTLPQTITPSSLVTWGEDRTSIQSTANITVDVNGNMTFGVVAPQQVTTINSTNISTLSTSLIPITFAQRDALNAVDGTIIYILDPSSSNSPCLQVLVGGLWYVIVVNPA